jgi:ABC-2 type transport system ATP-binding protein
LDDICGLVKITDVYGRVIRNLSKGYRQRVGLAAALVGNPPILILDEPTVGLDPMQIIEIRSLIKTLGKKHTVILSSHILPEIQAVCDRVVIINNGKIAADGTTDELTRNMSSDGKIVARVEGNREEILKVIGKIPGVVSVTADMEREKGVFDYEIETAEHADIRRELFKRLAERKWVILGLKTSEMTLEDIFLKITTGDSAAIPKGKIAKAAADDSGEEPADGLPKEETEADDKTEERGSGDGRDIQT